MSMVEKYLKDNNVNNDHIVASNNASDTCPSDDSSINKVTCIESLTNALGTLQALIHDAATSVDLQ